MVARELAYETMVNCRAASAAGRHVCLDGLPAVFLFYFLATCSVNISKHGSKPPFSSQPRFHNFDRFESIPRFNQAGFLREALPLETGRIFFG